VDRRSEGVETVSSFEFQVSKVKSLQEEWRLFR
jgi:hypothetical protein